MRLICFVITVIVAALLLGGCSQSNPADTMAAYLQALVEGDADTLIGLACADWEQQARVQAFSFRDLDARIDGLSCQQSGQAGEFTLVRCAGEIVITYAGEVQNRPLGTYRLIQENDEWKMCGEAE